MTRKLIKQLRFDPEIIAALDEAGGNRSALVREAIGRIVNDGILLAATESTPPEAVTVTVDPSDWAAARQIAGLAGTSLQRAMSAELRDILGLGNRGAAGRILPALPAPVG